MKATDSHRYLLLVFLTQSLGKELSNTPPEPYSRTFYPHAVKHLSVTHSIMWSFCTRELSLDDKVIYIFLLRKSETLQVFLALVVSALALRSLCMHVKLLQSYLTLCNRMDSTPPGYSVHGILQARILE